MGEALGSKLRRSLSRLLIAVSYGRKENEKEKGLWKLDWAQREDTATNPCTSITTLSSSARVSPSSPSISVSWLPLNEES